MGAAQHELGWIDVMATRVRAGDSFDKYRGRSPRHVADRVVHGRELEGGPRGDVEIVETDDGKVVGHE